MFFSGEISMGHSKCQIVSAHRVTGNGNVYLSLSTLKNGLYWWEPLLKALLSFMESDVCSSQSACHQQLSECYPASLLTSISVKLLLLLLLLVTFLLFYTIFSFILSQRGDSLYQQLHVLIHSKTLVMEFSFGINTWYRFEMFSLW